MMLLADTVLVLLTFSLYWPIRHAPFLFDDLEVLKLSRIHDYLRLGPLAEHPFHFFLHHVSSHCQEAVRTRSLRPILAMVDGRPLTYLTYNVDAWRGNIRPYCWHRTSIIIHAVNSLLVHHILTSWVSPLSAFLGALIFLAHPLSVMAVGYVAGRSSALCSLFMLAGIWAMLAHLYPFVLLFGIPALLSKPEAVIYPFLIGGLWWAKLR